MPSKSQVSVSTRNKKSRQYAPPRFKEILREEIPPSLPSLQAPVLCVPNGQQLCCMTTPEPPILPTPSIIVKIPSTQGGLQPSPLEHSQQTSTPASSTAMQGNSNSSSTRHKNEMCRDWYFNRCIHPRCFYAHKVIPSSLTCRDWLHGKCTRSPCAFVHKHQQVQRHRNSITMADDCPPPNQNHDGPIKNGLPCVSSDTQVDPVQPVIPSSIAFSAAEAEHPEVKLHNSASLLSVALANALPGYVEKKATDKVRPTTSVSCTSVASVRGPRARRPDSGGPAAPMLTANYIQSPSSITSKATDKAIQSASYETSSSGSSATLVEEPELKPPSSGRLLSTEFSATKVQKASSKSRVTRGPPVTSSSVSSATQLQKNGAKFHDPPAGKPFPVAAVNATPEVTSNKAPHYPKGDQPPQVCLEGRCTHSQCPFSHAHPPDVNTSETTRRNDDFAITVSVADHAVVKLKDGFEVQDVTTGFESRWVHIRDLPSHIEEPGIRALLEKYGQLDKLVVLSGTDGKSAKLTVRAQYSTASQAMEAFTELPRLQFQGKKLTVKMPLSTIARNATVLKDTDVRINWPTAQRLGYAGYATLDEAKAVIAAATGFVMKDNVLTAALYEGLPAVGAYSVMFCHLPADATRKDLEQFGNAESIMFERPNYQSLSSAREAILRQLHSCGGLSNFDLPLPIRNGMAIAWATFETHADAINARDYLDGQRPSAIGGKIRISARHNQSFSFILPLTKFKMLEGDISRLRWSLKTRFDHDVFLSDHLMSPQGPVAIRISAQNVSNLGVVKAEFEQLQHGEVVTLEKKPVWDGFFSTPSGQFFLRELECLYPGIEIQTRMGKILLHGQIAQRQLARRDIMKKFQELQARQRWYIPLSGKVVGAFVSKDLLTLQESVGRENCQILLSHERTLLIRGNEQTYRIACEAVEKVQSRYTDCPTAPAQSVCPVCFNEVSVPTRLTCGHSWCTSCLERYLVSAIDNKTFPLTCLGDDASCNQRISVFLAKKVLSGDDFTALCEASFWSHVHARTMEFHHCPTPDCVQVYRPTPGGAILQCPSCLIRICSACHMEAHDGLTCEERDAAEDKLFYEWAATHDVKNCPGCKTPIERSEGCNHMTCIRCQTHICWECLATFPKGEGIYQHMRYEHGGIGLEML